MTRTVHQKRSKLQERRGARQYDGRLTPGSGNQWHSKGDIVTSAEMIEMKTTTKSIYPLDSRELRKLWDNALLDNKTPVFEIEFAENGMTVVVLDKEDYIMYQQIAKYAGSYDISEGEIQ